MKYDENGKPIDDRNTEAGKNLGYKVRLYMSSKHYVTLTFFSIVVVVYQRACSFFTSTFSSLFTFSLCF